MTYAEKVAKAVADEDWQEFRLSLKGKPTTEKLAMLKQYWNGNIHGHVVREADNQDLGVAQYDCDYCIRVDNYIKALCRGGQLKPGESLFTALRAAWKLDIRK